MLSFSRHERLKSRKTIARLFTEGRSYVAYPLRVVWLEQTEGFGAESPAQVAIAVSKRNFKTAVERNRMKRLIREAYRLSKSGFYDKLGDLEQSPVAILLMYVAKEPLPFVEIQAGVQKMIRKFPG